VLPHPPYNLTQTCLSLAVPEGEKFSSRRPISVKNCVGDRCHLQLLLALASSGPSLALLMTIFYSLRFQTPTTLRARSQYLYPPGTGWLSYSPRHWVSSELSSKLLPAYNLLAWTAQKTTFLCCCTIAAFVYVGVPT
jgi:hypothetical protein